MRDDQMTVHEASVTKAHHLLCARGEVGGYVLLPGDPARSGVIAELFDASDLVGRSREFVTHTGTLEGAMVTVTSTGIGGPSMAIAVEELCELGAHTLIRVGTAGSIQPEVRVGSFVVVDAAIRDEGTTRQYVPLEFPAVASPAVADSLVAETGDLGVEWVRGVVHSKDSFYAQKRPETKPIGRLWSERMSVWEQMGAIASEMECAALFVVASSLGARAGAILKVMSSMKKPEERPESVSDLAEIAVGGLRRLIIADRQKPQQRRGSSQRRATSLVPIRTHQEKM